MDVPETKRLTSYVWKEIPSRARKQRAEELIKELLTGEKKAGAMNWLTRVKYGADALENFIGNMEAAKAARAEGEA